MKSKTRVSGDARVVFNVRLRPGALAELRREAGLAGMPVSEFWRALAADGKTCRLGDCDAGAGWKAKAVARGEEVAALLARVDVLEAHRCPEVETSGYEGPPREHGDPLGEDPLERFYDLGAPQEDEVDQARLVINAPRGRGVPPVVEENGWAG